MTSNRRNPSFLIIPTLAILLSYVNYGQADGHHDHHGRHYRSDRISIGDDILANVGQDFGANAYENAQYADDGSTNKQHIKIKERHYGDRVVTDHGDDCRYDDVYKYKGTYFDRFGKNLFRGAFKNFFKNGQEAADDSHNERYVEEDLAFYGDGYDDDCYDDDYGHDDWDRHHGHDYHDWDDFGHDDHNWDHHGQDDFDWDHHGHH